MTYDKGKKNAPLQAFDPQTLGWWAHSIRVASGWSQETVAELSGLSVRTIQRVEAGHPSSVDTRRALNYDDLDFSTSLKTPLKLNKYDLRFCARIAKNSKRNSFPAVYSSMQQKQSVARIWQILQSASVLGHQGLMEIPRKEQNSCFAV
jgi:transcriptional regulator with XRE-family HTH domain